MKTQNLNDERTCCVSRQALGVCRAAWSLFCGLVSVCGLVGARHAESATVVQVAFEEVVNQETALQEMALQEAALQEAALEPSAGKKSEVTVESLKRLSDDAQSLLVTAADAVVSIDGGSGVIVSRDGWVMTASHVCERPGREVQVRLANGVTWPARTFGVDRQKDTGMVKLLGDHVWPFVQVRPRAAVEPGDWCVVMGYPWEAENLKTPAIRMGRVTAIGKDRIVTDVPIIGGDSGGPVFSAKGDLLAISSRIRLDVNQNIHVPVETFVEQFDALKRAEFVRTKGVRKNETIDDSLPARFGRNAVEVRDAVAGLVAKCERSVVRLVSVEQGEVPGADARVVLGTVVTEAGLAVAKQSELRLPVRARVGEDWMDVELVAFDRTTDLALLQLKPKAEVDKAEVDKAEVDKAEVDKAEVDKAEVKFVPLLGQKAGVESGLVGRLILSLVKGAEGARLTASLGTVMVEPQDFKATVDRQGVDLGVVLDAAGGRRTEVVGVGISRVYPGSLAAKLKLRNGDRLVSIDGFDVKDEAGLSQVLGRVAGGQLVRFSIYREGGLLSFRASLPASLPLVWDRWGGGPFSGRRFGFGTVMAHDGVIDPSDCGGPVIDLEGGFVGINVSRAMRTTTYVVPAAKVQALVQRYQQSQ